MSRRPLRSTEIVGRLTNNPRGKSLPPVVATCKLGQDPIRSGDDMVWLRKPMGLSHRTCLAAAVAEGREVEA